METKERFPQDLQNLARNARFAHSHSHLLLERRKKDQDPKNDGCDPSSDQISRGESHGSALEDR
jgi:hypothetical protein